MQTLLNVAVEVYSTTRDIYVRLTGDCLTTESDAATSRDDFPEAERDDVILFCDGLYLQTAFEEYWFFLDTFEEKLQRVADEIWEGEVEAARNTVAHLNNSLQLRGLYEQTTT